MAQSFKLYRLQQIDSQLDQKRNRLREIEAALAENEAVRRAMQRLKTADEHLERERKQLRRAEEEVQALRVKIEQTESTLYGGSVRNPKELQDLQNESAALRRYLTVLEDRQLEEMLAVEEAEEQHTLAAEALETVQKSTAAANANFIEEQADLTKDVARQEAERQATASSIPEPDIRLYEVLRVQRNGIAVAKVVDKTCAACGSTLTAALLSSARSPHKLTRCATCGRILYAG